MWNKSVHHNTSRKRPWQENGLHSLSQASSNVYMYSCTHTHMYKHAHTSGQHMWTHMPTHLDKHTCVQLSKWWPCVVDGTSNSNYHLPLCPLLHKNNAFNTKFYGDSTRLSVKSDTRSYREEIYQTVSNFDVIHRVLARDIKLKCTSGFKWRWCDEESPKQKNITGDLWTSTREGWVPRAPISFWTNSTGSVKHFEETVVNQQLLFQSRSK